MKKRTLNQHNSKKANMKDFDLPRAEDIEKCIMSSLMNERATFIEYSPFIVSDMFYCTNMRKIVQYMIEKNCNDPVVLMEKFPDCVDLITDCITKCASSTNILAYIDILKDKYYRRSIMLSAMETIKKAGEDLETDFAVISGELQQKISSLDTYSVQRY
jgi:replicative DNA helicase